jgi:hypothetical protein
MMFEQHRLAVDPGLVEEVVRLYRDLDNARGGEYGTWHSRRIRTNPYPWFTSTFNSVAETAALKGLAIDEWWFNCGAPGDEYRWHSHNPCPWAGVLYIQTPANSGGIEFKKMGEFFTFQPAVGDFLLFPGTLAHRVLKNQSADFRISAAFNFLNK